MGMTWGIIPGPQNEETHSQTPGFLVFPGGEAIRKKAWKVTMQYLLAVSTPLKNMKVTWDDDMIIPNIWKNNGKKSSKPPIRIIMMERCGAKVGHVKVSIDSIKQADADRTKGIAPVTHDFLHLKFP